MVKVLFTIFIAYVFLICIVFVMQRKMQYFPDTNHPGTPAQNGILKMQEIKVKTEDGLELLAWFAPPEELSGKIVIFYHGNAGNIAERAYKAKNFIGTGYGVFFCEYRGYGGNPGFPNEVGIYDDARSSLKWLKKEGYEEDQWILFGESIGSGPAVQMAKEFKGIRHLVLEGGFSSAIDVANSVYPWLPVSLLMLDKYDNTSKIKDVKASLLMLHGEMDPVVDLKFGKKLFEAANHPKEFVTLKQANHVDLFDHGADKIIIEWLRRN